MSLWLGYSLIASLTFLCAVSSTYNANSQEISLRVNRLRRLFFAAKADNVRLTSQVRILQEHSKNCDAHIDELTVELQKHFEASNAPPSEKPLDLSIGQKADIREEHKILKQHILSISSSVGVSSGKARRPQLSNRKMTVTPFHNPRINLRCGAVFDLQEPVNTSDRQNPESESDSDVKWVATRNGTAPQSSLQSLLKENRQVKDQLLEYKHAIDAKAAQDKQMLDLETGIDRLRKVEEVHKRCGGNVARIQQIENEHGRCARKHGKLQDIIDAQIQSLRMNESYIAVHDTNITRLEEFEQIHKGCAEKLGRIPELEDDCRNYVRQLDNTRNGYTDKLSALTAELTQAQSESGRLREERRSSETKISSLMTMVTEREASLDLLKADILSTGEDHDKRLEMEVAHSSREGNHAVVDRIVVFLDETSREVGADDVLSLWKESNALYEKYVTLQEAYQRSQSELENAKRTVSDEPTPRHELENLNGQIRTLEAEVAALQNERNALKSETKGIESSYNTQKQALAYDFEVARQKIEQEVTDGIANLKLEISAKDARVAELQSKLIDAQQHLENIQQTLQNAREQHQNAHRQFDTQRTDDPRVRLLQQEVQKLQQSRKKTQVHLGHSNKRIDELNRQLVQERAASAHVNGELATEARCAITVVEAISEQRLTTIVELETEKGAVEEERDELKVRVEELERIREDLNRNNIGIENMTISDRIQTALRYHKAGAHLRTILDRYSISPNVPAVKRAAHFCSGIRHVFDEVRKNTSVIRKTIAKNGAEVDEDITLTLHGIVRDHLNTNSGAMQIEPSSAGPVAFAASGSVTPATPETIQTAQAILAFIQEYDPDRELAAQNMEEDVNSALKRLLDGYRHMYEAASHYHPALTENSLIRWDDQGRPENIGARLAEIIKDYVWFAAQYLAQGDGNQGTNTN